jgi:tetratricopeptide (TPR) repeat protein
MIELSANNGFLRFEEIWKLGSRFHDTLPQAALAKIRFDTLQGNYPEAFEQANRILDQEINPYYRAEAELSLALAAYEQKDYDTALRALRKIRLIHAEFQDILAEADYYYILCLLRTGARQEAQLLLWEVQDTLSDSQIITINDLMGGIE